IEQAGYQDAEREGEAPAEPRKLPRGTDSTSIPTAPADGVRSAQFEQPAPTTKPAAIVPDEKTLAATLAEVDVQLQKENWLAAHKELSRVYWAHPESREEFIDRINHTAQAIFFSPQPHFVEPHVISPGDRLQTVASKYKLTWEYLAQLNQIDPKRIRDGQRLKVIRGPFSAVVELSDYSMTVNLQGYFVKRYAVGIGKDDASPIGKHAVLNKVVNPQYTTPDGKVISGDDPANPLGERWIDLGHSYGIHGTIEPDSIGRAASRGCIRLGNEDVIEVYNFLVNGSEVTIRP
ncbi:MAG TPA: L,D-transpeptidase family protein, partial [Planctomycetaceae bacterium]|nr:L,D-transpeptidase family protein [Planctomycetaceae bacterium]